MENLPENNPTVISIINFVKKEYENQNYTIYRAAGKISTLKKLLFTSCIQFKEVLQVLEKHHLNGNDCLPIYPKKLIELLHDIFLIAIRKNYFENDESFNIKNAVGVLANFFWNIFNPKMTLLDLKETFLIFCEVNTLEDMISAFFFLVADHNRCISKYRFDCLMKVLAKILTYIGESDAYGVHNIPELVDQCFAQSPGILGLNEYQFHCLWCTTQTKFLNYANLLALIKRIKDADKLIHNIDCMSCGIENIQGIRFKCQVCKKLSICMKCFASGFENRKHSFSHRMSEVFTIEDNSQKTWLHYLTKFLFSFCLFKYNNINHCDDTDIAMIDKSRNCHVRFDNKSLKGKSFSKCVVDPVVLNTPNRKISSVCKVDNTQNNSNSNSFGPIDSSTIFDILNHISEQILSENEKVGLYNQSIDKIKQKNIYDFLENHQKVLTNLSDQMKCLINQSKSVYPLSSTPNRRLDSIATVQNSKDNFLKSLHGSEINKTYLEANKSDYSISELSSWFYQRKSNANGSSLCSFTNLNEIPSDIKNYRDLLNKVKEIIEDGLSNNSDLAKQGN